MPQNIAPPGLISLLAAALAQQPTKPLVLALDGRCGSGKSRYPLVLHSIT